MTDLFGQGDFAVRLDWGPAGARATRADVTVVVDVFSFSTSVTVAVERGMRVFPYEWKGHRAAEFAAAHDAVLVVGRMEGGTGGAAPGLSISSASLVDCEPVPQLVLPSPNGSAIARELVDGGSTVVAGCVRNATAVATWLSPVAAAGHSIAVIAAGERRGSDDSLRPALEDHLGAGATLSALARLGHAEGLSPEAWAAAEVFDASAARLNERLHNCVGGRELTSKGFRRDVDVASDRDVSQVVPVIVDGAFEASTEKLAPIAP